MYIFIHPTKSGGTSCERFFSIHYSNYIKGCGHENKCNNNNNSIIIVRDVKSRFISMFNYWKNGAIDTKYKRSKHFVKQNKDITILDFINILKTKERQLYVGFTWSAHFAQTTRWINNTNYENIIIVKYVDDLNTKIQSLLDHLNIPNKNIKLVKNNISKIIDYDSILFDHPIVDKFINEYFKDDIELYDTIINRPELFKLVI